MATGIAIGVVSGNLTRDAELHGRMLAFSVAVNRREKNRDSEEWSEQAHYFDCKVLGNRAEALANLLTKGTKVTVQGDLVQERWETDGQNRSAIRIIAREVVLGGSRDSAAKPESSSDGGSEW